MSEQEYEGQFEDEGTPRRGNGNGAPQSVSMVRREGFDMAETSRRAELAVATMSAAKTAMVQARFVAAIKMPRDPAQVRQEFLERCADPEFAEVAFYRRPQGKKKDEDTGRWVDNIIEGPSIRFVEGLIQSTPHMGVEQSVLYEDEDKVILRVAVVDYQRNVTSESEITVPKTIERRELKKGQRPLGTRQNSYGDTVYILPGTEADVRMASARLVSMTVRQLGLRVLPGGLVSEGKRKVYDTLKKQVTGKDPAQVRRETADKFAAMGISAAQIAEYFGGTSVAQLTDDQVLELRIIGASITNGEGRWAEYVDGSPWRKDEAEGEVKEATGKAADVTRKVQETLAKKRQGQAPPAQGAPAPQGQPAAAPAPAVAPPPAATPVAPASGQEDPLVAQLAAELSLPAATVGAALALVRAGKNAAYLLKYKKDLALAPEQAARIAEAVKPAAPQADGRSPEAIAAAVGLPVETVRAAIDFGAKASKDESDDAIHARLIDQGHNLTPAQMVDVWARSNPS